MTSPMPPMRPADRSTKEPGSDPKSEQGTSFHHSEPDTAERGETATVKRTASRGFFAGRRAR